MTRRKQQYGKGIASGIIKKVKSVFSGGPVVAQIMLNATYNARRTEKKRMNNLLRIAKQGKPDPKPKKKQKLKPKPKLKARVRPRMRQYEPRRRQSQPYYYY